MPALLAQMIGMVNSVCAVLGIEPITHGVMPEGFAEQFLGRLKTIVGQAEAGERLHQADVRSSDIAKRLRGGNKE